MKIFRHFRYSLLQKGKFIGYLKYSIGEVLLIILGILFAMNIDNWNENRIIQKNLHQDLRSLQAEISDNIDETKKCKLKLKKVISAQQNIIKLIDNQTDTLSEKFLSDQLLHSLFFSNKLNIDLKILNLMYTNENINNVTNRSLRSSITSISPLIKSVLDQEEKMERNRILIKDYFILHGNTRTVYELTGGSFLKSKTNEKLTTNREILNDVIFENLFIDYIGASVNLYSTHFTILEEELTKIEQKIDADLAKYKE